MTPRKPTNLAAALAVMALVVASGCTKDTTGLALAPFDEDPTVEIGQKGIDFLAFAGTNQAGGSGLATDATGGRDGGPALLVTVPDPSDPAGSFAGGVLASSSPRDLSAFNALTFWARASRSVSLDVVGFGDDNTGTSMFPATTNALSLTTSWRKYVVPIPLSAKLTEERGFFTIADGADGGVGYSIWLDDIMYENLPSITNPRPVMDAQTVFAEVGGDAAVAGTQVIFDLGGAASATITGPSVSSSMAPDVTVNAAPGYFTFSSSDESVATVGADGSIQVVGLGTAEITAMLGSTPVTGSVTVNGGAEVAPPSAAPTPTFAQSDVISLFSNAYTDVAVDTWSAVWDDADVSDIQVAGDDVKKYTDLVFAGIEFVSAPVDASAMNTFHMDIWTADPTSSGEVFKIKLVNAGADGDILTTGDNTEHELTYSSASTPALVSGAWVSLDIPLASFTGMTGTNAIAQLIISGDPNTVFVDNVYFHNQGGGGGGGGGGTAPTVAAPTPTQAAGDVISMFSNAYTNVTVDTWSAAWDQADVADVQIAGNDTKLYTNLVFAGIETVASPIDASSMTHFRMDIWTPDAVAAPVAFNIKLVDAGADGMIGTAGDNSEHQLVFNTSSTPALAQGSWVSFDIPLTDFVSLTGTSAIAQLIIDGVDILNTVYVDNVYFYNSAGGGGGGGGGGTAPTVAAPTPTEAAGDVISMFSNAYTNVTVDTWSAAWDQADVADMQVAGDDNKVYTNLVFAGIEMVSAPIDASTMTHFSMDIWTPDAVAAPVAFNIKLVDAGADGQIGTAGDNSEHQLVFNTSSTPALAQGAWVSFDIPLADFTGLTGTGAIAQLIIDGVDILNTVYVDNVYFYSAGGGGGGGGAPTTAAPTPTEAAGDVISMFSNAYTDVTVDTWSAAWDQADVADVQVAGDDNKLYTNLVFAGIEMVSAPIDASTMTHFSMDIWTPDAVAAPVSFNIKLVDAGADGQIGTAGDNSEHQLVFNTSSTPALMQGSWVSFDIPLADFTGLTGTSAIAQLIIDGVDVLNTVYVDNVYFYNAGGGGGGGGTGVIDFESGGLGASWTWNVFENVDNPPLQFVANPSQTGVNTSATVAMFTARMAGQPHAGTITTDYPTFTLDATNAVVKIMVYKSFVSDVGIKFENGTQGSTGEIKVANTLTNQWEELTFDFSGVIGDPNNTDITGLIVFPDFAGGRAADNVVYFDNISFNAGGGGGGGGGAPTVAAPTPTQAAGDVISMFSNAYTNVTVDRWSTDWDQTDLADVQVAGNDTKLYTNLVFAGIETTASPIDASGMTHFRMDIWTPDANTAPAGFNIKLVDAGADGQIGTAGDNSEHQLVFNATTTPALMQGQWISFDIPLTDFTNLTGTGAIAQLIIDGVNDINTVYVDNVYFYNSAGGGGGGGGGATEPTVAAPDPTQAAGDVISMFSNVYTDVTVDRWSTDWDQTDLADVQVAGNDTKLYTNLVFAGIETTASPIDASGMTHFRMDIWTPDANTAPAGFNIKLVDAGADGQIGTAGDNSEHQLVFNATTTPALMQGQWISFDIPLTDFTNLTGTGAIAQLIIDGVNDINTVYVDNVYFYNSAGGGGGGGGGGAPTTAAPTPTQAAGDVISMFSNAYTDVTVDRWSTDWDQTDLADVQVAGNDTKLYTNLVFAGIETTASPIDASGMTHFRMDIWTPDANTAPAGFNIKLVDAGADGQIGTAGDNSEHQLVFNATTTPALMQGAWISFDIPLTDFTGLSGTGAIAQLIIDGVNDINTVYVDNVYFYNSAGGGGGGGGGGSGGIDFEPGGLGASWTWNVFENVDNPPLQFVANPSATGANTSATVAMFTARMAGQPHAGTITLDSPTFTLDATNAVVRIMVYKSFVSDVGIKFENGTFGSTGEIKVANTLTNQWEELTFDFSGVIGDPNNTDITGLIVFPDFQGGRTTDNVAYFDNISFNAVP